MLYVIRHTFKDNISEARANARDAHLAHMDSAGDKLKAAGPLLADDSGDKVIGSLIVIEAGSHTAASLFADTDPYVTAGIVEVTKVIAWRAVLGEWGDGQP